jgi:serine protease DegQ
MRNASRSEAQQAGADGIVIESILPSSPAARAGLRAGDVIVAVNRSPVSSVAELRSAVAGQRTILALELIRDGGRFLLVVR